MVYTVWSLRPRLGQVNRHLWDRVWESGRHTHGKVTDEGCLGDFHIEGHFPGFVSSVDHLAGDDIVGETRGDFAVDFQTPDEHAINRLK